MGKPDNSEKVPVHFKTLNKVFEHRTRLAVCILLAREEGIPFTRFKALLEETDGNLGAQLRRLEKEGYARVEKSFEGRKPISRYFLTEKGKSALKKHLAALDALVSSLT